MTARREVKGECAILILAAGSSSRLGQSKQLVKINGQSLLQRTASIACGAAQNVLVVLGSNFEIHQKELVSLPVQIVNHQNWKEGMGSSLKAGVESLLKTWSNTSGILILVCDQPKLTINHLRNLLAHASQSEKPIICSSYQNTLGVPALFKKELFEKLVRIGNGEGAKKIIEQNQIFADSINFVGGEVDIDTPEDLKKIT